MEHINVTAPNQNPRNISPCGKFIRFNDLLGEGGFKRVYKAINTVQGFEVAWNEVEVDQNDLVNLVNEVQILGQLDHPNIIKLLDAWMTTDETYLNFITEIMSSGCLSSYLSKVPYINQNVIKRWAYQTLEGIEYLHSLSPPVIHRDLKSSNIFINGTDGIVKIGDLGLAIRMENGPVQGLAGTLGYMAPEVLSGGSYTEKADLFSFGMVLLELMTGEVPYSECKTVEEMNKKVLNLELPDAFSRLTSKNEEARRVILACFCPEAERVSAAQLFNYPFFNEEDNAMSDEQTISYCTYIPNDVATFLRSSHNEDSLSWFQSSRKGVNIKTWGNETPQGRPMSEFLPTVAGTNQEQFLHTDFHSVSETLTTSGTHSGLSSSILSYSPLPKRVGYS